MITYGYSRFKSTFIVNYILILRVLLPHLRIVLMIAEMPSIVERKGYIGCITC